MLKKILFLITISPLFYSFSSQAQSLNSIEAIEYDPEYNRWLITNNNSIIQRDSMGVLDYFGTPNQVTAGYGMEVMNGALYAIDGSQIFAYDLESETTIDFVSISGAGFLNGMASDPTTNRIWVTDFSAKRIIEIDASDNTDMSYDIIVSNTVTTPNGIVHDEENNRLVFVNWSANAPIKSVDLDTYEVSTLTSTSISNIDGIDIDNEGNFYISSWSPEQITKYNNDFSEFEAVLAPSPGLSSPADISYALELDTLGIANSGNSTITFIGFEPYVPPADTTGNNDTTNNDTTMTSIKNIAFNKGIRQVQIFPNPITEQSLVQYTLESPTYVEINIYNHNGQIVQNLFKGMQINGQYTTSLSDIQLSDGVYICQIKAGNKSIAKEIILLE